MPVNSSNSGFRPSPGVFFSPDGNGGLQVNSTGMWANMALQKLVYDQAAAKTRPQQRIIPEHVIQASRQQHYDDALDGYRKYLKKAGREGEDGRLDVIIGRKAFPAPTLISPQPLLTLNTTSSADLESYRAKQLDMLGADTFVGVALPHIYQTIDKGVKISRERREEILSKPQKKSGLFSTAFKKLKDEKPEMSERDFAYVMRPIEAAMENTNEVLAQGNFPVRVEFRKIWKSEFESAVQMYVMYPIAEAQAKQPVHKWEGMPQACDRNGNYLLNLQP